MFENLTDNVKWKRWKAQHQLSKNESDFLDRYAETLVALKRAEKSDVLLHFYGEQSVINIFHGHWYGSLSAADFERRFKGLAKHFTLDQQLDRFSADSEMAFFLKSFRGTVNNNRTAGDTEIIPKNRPVIRARSKRSRCFSTQIPDSNSRPRLKKGVYRPRSRPATAERQAGEHFQSRPDERPGRNWGKRC